MTRTQCETFDRLRVFRACLSVRVNERGPLVAFPRPRVVCARPSSGIRAGDARWLSETSGCPSDERGPQGVSDRPNEARGPQAVFDPSDKRVPQVTSDCSSDLPSQLCPSGARVGWRPSAGGRSRCEAKPCVIRASESTSMCAILDG